MIAMLALSLLVIQVQGGFVERHLAGMEKVVKLVEPQDDKLVLEVNKEIEEIKGLLKEDKRVSGKIMKLENKGFKLMSKIPNTSGRVRFFMVYFNLIWLAITVSFIGLWVVLKFLKLITTGSWRSGLFLGLINAIWFASLTIYAIQFAFH
jgi:hypothetical protein